MTSVSKYRLSELKEMVPYQLDVFKMMTITDLKEQEKVYKQNGV